jgi:DNA-binding PadR family transcriptional regulator
MYPFIDSPPPLRTGDLYVLLALFRMPLHAYGIQGEVIKGSLGSVQIKGGRITLQLRRMHDEGLIDLVGNFPAGASGKDRKHYEISEYGIVRLQEELARLDNIIAMAQGLGLRERPRPTDLERSLLEGRITGSR